MTNLQNTIIIEYYITDKIIVCVGKSNRKHRDYLIQLLLFLNFNYQSEKLGMVTVSNIVYIIGA